MTDLSISQPQSAFTAGKIAAISTQLIARFRTATKEHADRKAARRAPEAVLMAQARREEARRAVDRLWLQR